MPFTFLAHQAPVLGLKLAAPRWFDGTALAIGSMAPDLVFIFGGTRAAIDGHSWAGQLQVCLPLTMVLTVLTKKVASRVVVPHLPDAGRFHVHDYARLAGWRITPANLLVATLSASIGSVTHVALDAFTHSFGWGVHRFPALSTVMLTLPSGRSVPVYDVLQLGGSALGAAVALGLLARIGRRRLLLAWYPEELPQITPTASSTRRFLGISAAGVVGSAIVVLLTVKVGAPQDIIIRAADLVLLSVFVAGFAAQPEHGGRSPT